MELNLVGEIMAIKEMGQKPNYSDLQRKYGTDRHTIKKYFVYGKKPYKKRPPVPSKYDAYRAEVEAYLSRDGSTMMAAFMYVRASHPSDAVTYDGFKSWCRGKGIPKASEREVHPRFETPPGRQAQFDWKEDISLSLSTGEVVAFNVFTMTYGYSRMHMFAYSDSKTTEDLIRCLIECVSRSGGVPRGEYLTDNMAAIVSVRNGGKRKHPKIIAFERDLGCRIALCRARRPETKGKDESANRFVEWLMAYDGKLASKADIASAIATVEAQCNSVPNRTTSMPPSILWKADREALLPGPGLALMESYLDGSSTVTVPSTLLVSLGGRSYSVPPEFVGRRVTLMPAGGSVYVYFSGKLVAVRGGCGAINYDKSDYMAAIASSYKGGADIEKMAEESLCRLSSLGKEAR